MCDATPVRLVSPNMSLYYSFHFRGQSCRLSGYFFQKFFQAPQTGIDRAGDSALISTFRFCDFRLAHAVKIVCVNPVPLFLRQRGKCLIQPGIFLFLFQNFSRRQDDHQRVTFHTGIVVQRKIRLVPVCTQDISGFSQLVLRRRSATSSGTSAITSCV